jgi:hypothetical protein
MTIAKRQNKIGTYLAVTAGVGCVSSMADAATLVQTFSGTTTRSITSADLGSTGHTWAFYPESGGEGVFKISSDSDGKSSAFFSQGDATALSSAAGGMNYFYGTAAVNGAVIDGVTKNYIELDFLGTDTVKEAVAEMIFDGAGGGYFTAVAWNDDLSALSVPDAVTAINSVPEPSSLSLLALGATGLLARRRRKAA